MNLKKNKTNIKKLFFKKKCYNKYEIKKTILKSIIQNKNIKPITRSYSFYKLNRLKYIYSISKQKTNICIYTGRYKGVFKSYLMSRHFIKKLSYSNDLKNSKILNW